MLSARSLAAWREDLLYTAGIACGNPADTGGPTVGPGHCGMWHVPLGMIDVKRLPREMLMLGRTSRGKGGHRGLSSMEREDRP